ncbi:yellow laccase [Flagelloscypha sp. PMI_526]|nr:yellow laccase [Flagelloscypha sp. PMI_526]
MFRLLSLFPLFLAVVHGALPSLNTRTDLFIVNKDVSPDGFTRPAVVAGTQANNAAVVGPLITGLKGGKYSINVHDQLTNADMIKGTSIHWHGVLQKKSTWADGPAFVNQCPISPGNSFTYQFATPDQAGTYWYHSHIGLQYCDGLRGPLVVYDLLDPHRLRYDVDDASTVITIADWYHKLAKDFAGPAIPDATLINGKGRYSGGPASELSVIKVLPFRRYRIRLVSMSCDANFVFQILGHDLTIIEADGVSTHPHTVRSLQIFAGQRYSFVLKTNQPIGNYWIRAKPNAGNGLNTFDGGLNSAILRYLGAPNAEPPATQTEDPTVRALVETDLHALTSPVAPGQPRPGGADVNINLLMGFSGGGFTVNGVAFRSPTLPVLNQILAGARTAQELLPPGSIYELPRGKTVELSIPGGLAPGAPHPIHLHGHEFYVVRSAGSTVYNYANPVRRDVVSTGVAGDNVTIRFQTDNAGVWFLHCHIDPHLELGFAVVFAERVDEIPAPPTAWTELCPEWEALNSQDAVIANGNGTDSALISSLQSEQAAAPPPPATDPLISPTIITEAAAPTEDDADLSSLVPPSTTSAAATATNSAAL